MAAVEARIHPSDGCWLWTGSVNRKGYGYIQFMGRPWLAHRLMYTLHVGPIPAGLFVCHQCDTPACVRPEHLWLGTKGDNNRDMGQKGRAHGKRRPGSLNFQAKLTVGDIEGIRARYLSGEQQRPLAAEYGIRQAQVSRIVRNESWIDPAYSPPVKPPPMTDAESQRRYRARKRAAIESQSTLTGDPLE